MGLIIAENITKDYHVGEVTVRALKGVSFNMDTGSFMSLREWEDDVTESHRLSR